MYPEASNYVQGVDTAFKVIFGISIFFLIGITIVMLYFVYRYHRKKHPRAVQVKEKTWVEVTWTVIPLLLVMLMFYYGYIAYKPMREVPPGAMEVTAIGKMWEWSFEYKGGRQSGELVVPIDKPVRLNLVALDVIHSLYIPAFRIKEDMVPGTKDFMWFTPQRIGEFEILCAEYCGMKHSFMESKVRVLSQQDFDVWLSALPEKMIEHEGLSLIKKNGCTGCHSLDGKKGVSTTFKNLYGTKRVVITSGNEREAIADDFYIKQSVFNPSADVVKGYPDGVMKSYKGVVTKDEAAKIIEYLKTIKD